MAKLKNLLGEVFEDVQKVDKHRVIEGVRNYGIVGKSLYNNSNIMEVAKQLAEVAESAHSHILGEQDDWFDKISVNKNMKSLKTGVMEFQKTAKEAHSLNQRLTGLYEDIGHVLNRYYEIDESLDHTESSPDKPDREGEGRVNDLDGSPKSESLDHGETVADKPDKEGLGRVNNLDSTPKTEALDSVGKEDDDVDNDGDSDASDKYLKTKRDAVTKAVKETAMNMKKSTRRLSDVKNVVSLLHETE